MRREVNGILVEYEVSGPLEGPVVTFCHALATNHTVWKSQVKALEAHHRVLRYDVRGHGKSGVSSAPYSFSQLVADLTALLDALHVEKTHFVGISLGGMIGQWFALAHPDRLHTLVLADASARTAPEARAVWDDRIAIAASEGMEAHVDATIARWFTPRFVRDEPAVIEQVRTMIRSTPVEGYIGCASAVREHDALERLGEIGVPTMILVGDQDPGMPVARAEEMQQRMTGSDLVVLEAASHLSNVEQAEAFTDALQEFLSRAHP
jgi:3-oxoadipate enol-lactonase